MQKRSEKSEIRVPKSERRPNPEIRIPSGQFGRSRQTREAGSFSKPARQYPSIFGLSFGFRISEFGLLSAFGFRISDFLAVLFLAAFALSALAQPRPYIGFVYPAGGRQGTTFTIRLGGQTLDDVSAVQVTGSGVAARITDNYRRLDNQELQLLSEQARLLRREMMSEAARASLMETDNPAMMMETSTNPPVAARADPSAEAKKEAARKLVEQIEKRTGEYAATPASAALASLVMVEVNIAPDAEPGEREIRLVTLRGISNPLAFYVGQVPEFSKKPMLTAIQQVLGKESQALRKRPAGEDEERITLPCTVNGQIASGEVNRYRFEARKGQHLVVTTLGRQLVPFIADAVPGWFQPVLALYDAQGKEVAYDDDYRFKPDPTILYEVPRDGEYVFAIHDSLYRGREDFVYRITVGELPFITSVFPLGAQASSEGNSVTNGPPSKPKPELKGWNLQGAELTSLSTDAGPGIHWLAATKKGLVSNRVPYVLDTLPEAFEGEPNNTIATAQKVTLPVIINGRIDKPDDWDVFQFVGKSNDTLVAEVMARRLDSPLDSVIKLTDETGNLLAFNDDHEDLTEGLNTHAADSYLMTRLPADGTYFVHIGDTARQGGVEYGYRLRLSAPRPDFDLRTVPSSLSLRAKSAGSLTIYAQRKDGFAGPIKLSLTNAPPGFTASPVTLAATQTVARLNVRTDLVATKEPISLSVFGTAKVGDQELIHEAVPAEDRMQAFLWRQLVPAKDFRALVFDPAYQPPPKRIALVRPPLPATNSPTPSKTLAGTNTLVSTNALAGTNSATGTNVVAKPKFSKQQVAYRLRILKLLFEEGLLTDDFYADKVAECQTE